MKILVTGGTGLLGNTIIRQLVDEREESSRTVSAFIRSSPPVRVFESAGRELDIEIERGDVVDRAAIDAAVEGCDAVIHSAGMIHLGWKKLDESLAVNRDGTKHFVNACIEHRVPLVHVGTVNTLAIGSRDQPATETTPIERAGGQVLSSYVVSKRAGIAEVERGIEKGLRAVIVHPGFMLGPWDWKPSSGRMVLEVSKSWKPIAPSGGCSVCDARDVAKGAIAALDGLVEGRIENGRHFILAGENQTYRQLWSEMAVRMGQRTPVMRVGPAMRYVAGWAGDLAAKVKGREGDLNSAGVRMSSQYHWYDSSRARDELGYQNRPVEQTLDDAVEWLRANFQA